MKMAREKVRVWDPLVRFGHWSLVVAFFLAYFTAEDFEDIHVAAGYWVGGYVVLRVVWGFVGSRHARFSDFVRGPRETLAYLTHFMRRKPGHYLGHNPLGGAMIVALLLSLAVTVVTGMALQADTENEGLLAPWLGHAAAGAQLSSDERAGAASAEAMQKGDDEDSVYEEVHEFFANLTLTLVVLHLLGVVAGSIAHRENLVRAMITGDKQVAASPPVAGQDRD